MIEEYVTELVLSRKGIHLKRMNRHNVRKIAHIINESTSIEPAIFGMPTSCRTIREAQTSHETNYGRNLYIEITRGKVDPRTLVRILGDAGYRVLDIKTKEDRGNGSER